MKRIEFNCVEMKHKGAEYVLAQTSGLSKEQELKFWQEQSKHLREHQKSLSNGVRPHPDVHEQCRA